MIDPKAGTGNLEAKQPFIDNGLDVYDPSRYYSAEFMQREWTNMWTRCCLRDMVGGRLLDVCARCQGLK